MENRIIRKAREEDLPEIMEIYAWARGFMAGIGNPTQWGTTEPKRITLEQDISLGQLFVVQEQNRICGVFAFILGKDPTYGQIDGSWHYSDPYGTLHRVAGRGKEILASCLAYCRQQADHLRIDTHENNIVMRRAIEKNGFSYCGIIHIADGSPRLAYDWHNETPA